MIQCDPKQITYEVAPDGLSITFHPCNVTSYNPNDIAERYCAVCHRFMNLVDLAKQPAAETSEGT